MYPRHRIRVIDNDENAKAIVIKGELGLSSR